MTKKIIAVRGMNDILPPDTYAWQYAENLMRKVFHSYGYQEIRFPIVESTDLFKRSIGEVTDIVEKEMYTFEDRNGDSLSLRPEGTASCVRAGIEHGLLYNQIQRLWYNGPFFRHERPQKGRYRQFHQCSAEFFGIATPDADAEVIQMSAHIIENLGLLAHCKLEINSIGTKESRQAYRETLIEYFKKHQDQLDEDSLRRLETNPLRILDSKNPKMQDLIKHAPKITEHLDKESAEHFEKLQQYLIQAGVHFEINPCLVRGLDYYSKTVFEWTTTELGAQGTICAGGRYDSLVEQLGGKATPALGFSIGMERTILLMQSTNHNIKEEAELDLYIVTDSEESYPSALKIANYLRKQLPSIHLILHCGGGNIKSQLKKADKSGAKYAVILGEREIKTRSVTLKPLRDDSAQQTLYQDALVEYLKLKIKRK